MRFVVDKPIRQVRQAHCRQAEGKPENETAPVSLENQGCSTPPAGSPAGGDQERFVPGGRRQPK